MSREEYDSALGAAGFCVDCVGELPPGVDFGRCEACRIATLGSELRAMVESPSAAGSVTNVGLTRMKGGSE